MMNQIALIVCEQTGEWAAALRRQLDGNLVRLFESRSFVECRQLATQHSSVVVVLELSGTNASSLVAVLRQLERALPNVRPIVVADRQLAMFESLMREAGAIHFLVSPRSLSNVVELAKRRAAEMQAAVSETSDDDDPRPAILARLPWSDMIG
jgi:DNA-binding NtrC family response regulator